MRRLCLPLLVTTLAYPQLIPAGRPVPRTAKPPAVFLNGYQAACAPSRFSDTFAAADQVLQRNGQVSLFFDNCAGSVRLSLEELGQQFGAFLRDLRYEDGQAVPQVDVVAHSMGGLIVRSYLAGKQTQEGAFAPPAETHIRKIVFLATPHFGSALAALTSDRHADALRLGSLFVFDLATWNQGSDDLRGVDAIAVLGNAGTGVTGNAANFDDSTTALTSGSLGFAWEGRTRILPYCHTTGGLITLLRLCPPDAKGIAQLDSDTHDSARIIVSFLNGTEGWRSIGQVPEQNTFLSANAGLLVRWRSNADQPLAIESATAAAATGAPLALTVQGQQAAYRELVPAESLQIEVRAASQSATQIYRAAAGAARTVTVKAGPVVGRVLPAASVVFPLTLAPGMFVAIYGAQLATATTVAPGLSFPTRLGDTEVFIGGTAIPLHFVSAGQINAVLPEGIAGLVKLRVRNPLGEQTVNVVIEAAVPAIFTENRSGSGLASALNAVSGALVTPEAPLQSGDYAAIYLTGLGNTVRRDGLDWAVAQPSVTVGGRECTVTYAGRAPGYVGMDQINCQLPAGLETNRDTPLVVTSAGRTSNTVTLPVR